MRLLAGLFAVVISASLAGCGDEEHGPTPGPLKGDGGAAYRSYYEMDAIGSAFSEGMQILHTREKITLVSVDVEGGDQALEYLGARIGLPGRRNDFHQFMKGFPPRAVAARYQVPAEGTVLKPDDGYMLIIGYRVRAQAIDLRRTVTVHYRTTDGEELSREYDAQVATCPRALTEYQCVAQVDEEFGDL